MKVKALEFLTIYSFIVVNTLRAQIFLAQNSSMLYEILKKVSDQNQQQSISEDISDTQNITILLLSDTHYNLTQDTTFSFPKNFNLTFKSEHEKSFNEEMSTAPSSPNNTATPAPATIRLTASNSYNLSTGFIRAESKSFIHLDNIHISNSTGGFFDQVTNMLITNCVIDNYRINSLTDYFLNMNTTSFRNHIIIRNTSIINNQIGSINNEENEALFLIGNRRVNDEIKQASDIQFNIENSTIAGNMITSMKSNKITIYALFHLLFDSANNEGANLDYIVSDSIIQSNYVSSLGSTFLYLGISCLDENKIHFKNVQFENNTIAQLYGSKTDFYFQVFPASFISITPVTNSRNAQISLLFENTKISNSRVDQHDVTFLYVNNMDGTIDFNKTEVKGNSLNGGRLFFMTTVQASVTFAECDISENILVNSLLWYRIYGIGDLYFQSSVFVGNIIQKYSTLLMDTYSFKKWLISDAVFEGNRIEFSSTGIYTEESSYTISSCKFSNSTLNNEGTFIQVMDGFGGSLFFMNENELKNNTISSGSNFFIFQGPSVVSSKDTSVSSFHELQKNNISENYISSSSQLFWISKLNLIGLRISETIIDESTLISGSNILLAESSSFISIEESIVRQGVSDDSPFLQFSENSCSINISNSIITFLSVSIAPSIQFNATTGIVLSELSFSNIETHDNEIIAFFDESTGFIEDVNFENNDNSVSLDIFVQVGSEVSCSNIDDEEAPPTFNDNANIVCSTQKGSDSITPTSPTWLKSHSDSIIISSLILIIIGLFLYTLRKRIYRFYRQYLIYQENRRKANMREHQLKGLISAFGTGTQTQEIESTFRATLPHVIIPFEKKIKLDGGEIARGGSGIVMKGTLLENETKTLTIAVKVIQSQMAGEIQELKEELSMLYSLNHPNIVSFIGVSFYSGAVMILQEYCPKNLKEYIQDNGKFKEINPFLDMILLILEALSFLHDEKNIAHRDLKPANILVDKDNHPKICDLGMAKFVAAGEKTLYRGNDAFGTPSYTPPEVFLIKEGERYEPKTWDVFSMAMVIYFMWTGQHPFAEFQSAFGISDEIIKGARPFLPDSIPSAVRDTIRHMWNQDPSKRITVNASYMELHKLYVFRENSDVSSHIQLNPLTNPLAHL